MTRKVRVQWANTRLDDWVCPIDEWWVEHEVVFLESGAVSHVIPIRQIRIATVSDNQ